MKRLILIVIAILFFSVPCWASQYCLVENGEIIKGPQQLPTAWGNTSGLNHLDDAGLKVRGWLPYIDNKPAYNSDLQYLTSVKVVGENDVTKTYTIHDYTGPEMVQRIADAKTAKVASLKSLARQKALVQYSKWVKDKSTAIDGLETLEAIRDYTLTTPDFDTISTNILAAIAASGIADMTFAKLDTYVETTFSNLSVAQQTALKKAFKAVLALVKLQMGNE